MNGNFTYYLHEEYFNFNSHHPYNEKKRIIRSLKRQAKAISRYVEAYKEEMNSLRHNLHRNNN